MQLDLAAEFILNKLRQELSPALAYHNVCHTEDVYQAARSIALSEGIKKKELQLLLTAALFHDSGFLIAPKNHELSSCSIARKYLTTFAYTFEEIEQICSLIMATQVPQNPQTHLQQILCDADLDYLGRADFFEGSRNLCKEMKNLGAIASDADYMRKQVEFLKAHRYFTATAKNRRAQKKEEHLGEIERELVK